MESLEKFIFLNKPFGYYISSNIKKVLSDFLELEKFESTSYSYQYLNSSYYRELAFTICMWIAEKNVGNNVKLNMDSMEIGQNIQYKNKYYRYLGRDSRTNGYKMQLIYNNDYDFSVFFRESLEDGANIVMDTKNREISDVRKVFGRSLGIENISMTNEESIIILMERRGINELLNASVTISGVTYNLDQLCSSRYLKDDMEIVALPKMNNVEIPIVLFSSSVPAVVEYIEDGRYEVQTKKVFVIGDKWFKENQIPNMRSLEDVCQEFHIPLSTFSSVSMVMKEKTIDLLEKIGEEYCWLDTIENQENRIEYHFIENNQEFNDLIESLNKILENIKSDSSLKYLDNLLKKFLKMSYSQGSGKSQVLFAQKMTILSYLQKRGSDYFEEISIVLDGIYNNRFGYQVKKKIKRVRKQNNNCALIVMKEMLDEITRLYQSDNKIRILPYSKEIGEYLYNQFDQIILLSPYEKDRRKWISSYLSSNIDVIIPRIQENYLKYSLKKDRRNLNNLYRLDLFGYKTEDSIYLNSIEKYLDSTTSNYISNKRLSLYQDLDIEEYDLSELSKETDYEEYDQGSANVILQLELSEDNKILATEYGKIFIIDNDNRLKNIDVAKVNKHQMVVEFHIPYSDEFYRRKFKQFEEVSSSLSLKQMDAHEYYDFVWKYELLKFVKKYRLNANELKKKFESIGFSDKTVAFYRRWSSEETLGIVPQDQEFIKYVGILIGNEDIKINYKEYAAASELVKKKLSATREKIIESMDGKSLDKVISNSIIESYEVREVIRVEDVLLENIPRVKTNKIFKE